MEELPRIHFFSWETRISIELPIGFEEQNEDPETSSAIYADDLDEDEDLGARLMTRMTATPSGAAEAYRSLADAAAQIGTRTVERHEDFAVDGAPAVRQVLRYHDEDAEIDVVRHETYAQIDNVVFSVICLAPASKAADYAEVFDHASRTARIVLLPLDGELQASRPLPVSGSQYSRSFAHAGLRLSALVPDAWTVTEPAQQTIRFFAPEDQQDEASVPTFSIALGEPDGFAHDGFADFCDASVGRLEREIPKFALRSIERYSLSSFADVHAVWYDGTWDMHRELVQLQALVFLDRYHMYLINAAVPRARAEYYLPLFDAVLRSIRVLPSRTAT